MLDFPSSPANGAVFRPPGLPNFIFDGTVWTRGGKTAMTKNRIVNPVMQISQQNGDAAASGAPVNSYYPADQWRAGYQAGGGGVLSVQRVQSATSNGSQNRLRISITTADIGVLAGKLIHFYTVIEGNRITDFIFGSANAKSVILRFGFKAPAGTYSVYITNSAFNRAYVKLFTITAGQANIDTEQVMVIPGDVAGAWPTDNSGSRFGIAMSAGSTNQGVEGWQSGYFISAPGCSDGWAVLGNVFELFDVGLYLDPDNTGVPPPWQMPDESDALRECQRYWCAGYGMRGRSSSATVIGYASAPLPVPMRTAPAIAIAGAPSGYDGGVTLAVSAVSASQSNMNYLFGQLTTASGLTATRAGGHIVVGAGNYMACNARL